MTKTLLHSALAILSAVAFLHSGSVYAQSDTNKNATKILNLFKPIVLKSVQSTVCVEIEGRQVALGTVVDANGFIITKDSELKGSKIKVRFKEGPEFEAKKIATNEDYDLAMLKVEAKSLTPISWSFSNVAPVGNWVATPGIADKPLAIGVVSVAARKMPASPRARSPFKPNSGYLGVALEADPNNRGAVITSVSPNTPAEKAGLKQGDIVIAVEGKETPDPDALMAAIGQCKPGQTVAIRFRRSDKEDEVKAKLDQRPQDRGDMQNSMGTSRSDRRTGFPVTLQHDTDLKAAEMGGPLVDIEGRVIGINIARGGRTDTYAIPAEEVLQLLPDMMKGKSTLAAKTLNTLDERIKAQEAKVKETEAVKSAAEKDLAKEKAALDKLYADKKKEIEKKKENELKKEADKKKEGEKKESDKKKEIDPKKDTEKKKELEKKDPEKK